MSHDAIKHVGCTAVLGLSGKPSPGHRPDGYAAMAEKVANDPALRAAVASELATRAMALIKQRGYTADSAEVHAVAAAYSASPSFPAHFADANRLVHSWMFAGTGALVVFGVFVALLGSLRKR